MKSVKNSLLMGHLCALFSVTAWGTSFLVSKELMTKISPVPLMWIRFVIAYLALWIVCPKWRVCWKEEMQFLLLALVGNTLYFLAENRALRLTQASNVSILVSTAPILSVLVMRLFRQNERFSMQQLTGFGIAFLGVFLVVFNGVFVLKLNPMGDLLALCAALLWAAYGLVAKRSLQEFDSFFVTRKMMFYGIVSSAPLLLLRSESLLRLSALRVSDYFNLLYLGVVCSAICYVLWNRAIWQLGTLKTNLYVYAVPLVTMLASALFMKERITLVGFWGIALVVGGMVLSSLELHRRKTSGL